MVSLTAILLKNRKAKASAVHEVKKPAVFSRCSLRQKIERDQHPLPRIRAADPMMFLRNAKGGHGESAGRRAGDAVAASFGIGGRAIQGQARQAALAR